MLSVPSASCSTTLCQLLAGAWRLMAQSTGLFATAGESPGEDLMLVGATVGAGAVCSLTETAGVGCVLLVLHAASCARSAATTAAAAVVRVSATR